MEQIGIVKDVNFGMRDCSAPVLWFVIETLLGDSLHIFNIGEAVILIEDSKAYSINDLEGRACVVETNGLSVKLLRWYK